MKPKESHDEAMKLSFQANLAMERNDFETALKIYSQAAELENSAADFYFDKAELEPTRSILIRSAAFLNLKAGDIGKAEKYIFWGIINSTDSYVKEQFYQALEWALSYRNLNQHAISRNVYFLNELRKKSIDYVIEPKDDKFSKTVSLEMISDFSNNYTKAIKAFGKAEFVRQFSNLKSEKRDIEEDAEKFEQSINPLLTNASFGGFKFSVATNFISDFGEMEEVNKLKTNTLRMFHNDVFKQDFTSKNIEIFKQKFSDDQREQIFRPVFHIRNNASAYRVSYFDRNTVNKYKINSSKKDERTKLLPVKTFNNEEIGELENILLHTRETNTGASRNTILRQKLSSYSFVISTNYIEQDNLDPIILNFEIKIKISFDSKEGFNFFNTDLPVTANAKNYPTGLKLFYKNLVVFIKDNVNKKRAQSKRKYSFLIT